MPTQYCAHRYVLWMCANDFRNLLCNTAAPRNLRHCIVGTGSNRVAEIDCTFCIDWNCFGQSAGGTRNEAFRIYFVVPGNQRVHIVVQQEIRRENLIENNNQRLCARLKCRKTRKRNFNHDEGRRQAPERGNYLKLINNANAKCKADSCT